MHKVPGTQHFISAKPCLTFLSVPTIFGQSETAYQVFLILRPDQIFKQKRTMFRLSLWQTFNLLDGFYISECPPWLIGRTLFRQTVANYLHYYNLREVSCELSIQCSYFLGKTKQLLHKRRSRPHWFVYRNWRHIIGNRRLRTAVSCPPSKFANFYQVSVSIIQNLVRCFYCSHNIKCNIWKVFSIKNIKYRFSYLVCFYIIRYVRILFVFPTKLVAEKLHLKFKWHFK